MGKKKKRSPSKSASKSTKACPNLLSKGPIIALQAPCLPLSIPQLLQSVPSSSSLGKSVEGGASPFKYLICTSKWSPLHPHSPSPAPIHDQVVVEDFSEGEVSDEHEDFSDLDENDAGANSKFLSRPGDVPSSSAPQVFASASPLEDILKDCIDPSQMVVPPSMSRFCSDPIGSLVELSHGIADAPSHPHIVSSPLAGAQSGSPQATSPSQVPFAPSDAQWRDLFVNNRSSALYPKLTHFSAITESKMCKLLEDDASCDV